MFLRFMLQPEMARTLVVQVSRGENMRRLDQARNLLLQGNSPASAAFDTHFADQSHMNRHFKKTYGLTPKQRGLVDEEGLPLYTFPPDFVNRLWNAIEKG